MSFHPAAWLPSAIALFVGLIIGLAFGLAQDAARRRHEKLQQAGKFNGRMSAVPDSAKRVAILVAVLVIIQIFCPLLFADGTQWWVSGGVLAGYGWQLFRQLQAKRRALGN